MHDERPAPGAAASRADTDPRRRPLTPRQRRFVQEYLIDLNAAAAARRAGYSKKSSTDWAWRLLRKPAVAAAVEAAQAARAERTRVTADTVVKELAKVAFGDARDLLSWGKDGVELRDSKDLTDAAAALVSEVSETRTAAGGTRRVKLHCKLTALTALGRHLGLFSGRLVPPGPGADDEDGGAAGAEDARERLARKIARIAARLRAEETSAESDDG